jgi:hypothetical protein
MKTERGFLSILLAVLAAGIGVITGCDSRYNDAQQYEELFPPVYFRDLSVEDTQKLVQGKWNVFQASGGFAGTTERINLRIEFIDTTIWRTDDGNTVTDRVIDKWEKINTAGGFGTGIYIHLKDGFSTKLVSLRNDTLHYTDALYDGYDYLAVKIKD